MRAVRKPHIYPLRGVLRQLYHGVSCFIDDLERATTCRLITVLGMYFYCFRNLLAE